MLLENIGFAYEENDDYEEAATIHPDVLGIETCIRRVLNKI